MTGKAILEALSFIDEQYIEEAENGTIHFLVKPFAKVLISLAACLCLVFGMNSLVKEETAEAQMPQEQALQDMTTETWEVMNKEENASLADVDIAIDEASTSEACISAILRIQEWTGDGFAAIVETSDDTNKLQPGMPLDVFFLESICVESYSGELVTVERRLPTEVDFPAGAMVQVRIVHISDDQTAILIESIAEH